jgi:hypothetical protein
MRTEYEINIYPCPSNLSEIGNYHGMRILFYEKKQIEFCLIKL